MPVSPSNTRPLISDVFINQLTESIHDVRSAVVQEQKDRVASLGSLESMVHQRHRHVGDQLSSVSAKVDSLELVVSRLQASVNGQGRELDSMRMSPRDDDLRKELAALTAKVRELEMARPPFTASPFSHAQHHPTTTPAPPRPPSPIEESARMRTGFQAMNSMALDLFFQQSKDFMDEVELQIRQLKEGSRQDRARTDSQIAALTDALERTIQEQQETATHADHQPDVVLDELRRAFATEASGAVRTGIGRKAIEVCEAVGHAVAGQVDRAVELVRRDFEQTLIPHVEAVRAIEMNLQRDTAALNAKLCNLEMAHQHTLGGLTHQVQELDGMLKADGLGGRLGAVEQSVDEHSATLRSIDTALKQAHTSMVDISNSVSADTQRVADNTQGQLDRCNALLQAAEARITALEESHDALEKEVLHLHNEAAQGRSNPDLEEKVAREVAELASHMATLEEAWRREGDVAELVAVLDAKMEREFTEVSTKINTTHLSVIDLEKLVTECSQRVTGLSESVGQDDPAELVAVLDAKLDRELTEVSAKINTTHMYVIDLEKHMTDRNQKVDDYMTQLDEGLRQVENTIESTRSSRVPRRHQEGGSSEPYASPRGSGGDDSVRRYCERRLNEQALRINDVEEFARKGVDQRVDQCLARVHETEDMLKQRLQDLQRKVDGAESDTTARYQRSHDSLTSQLEEVVRVQSRMGDDLAALQKESIGAAGRLQRQVDEQLTAAARLAEQQHATMRGQLQQMQTDQTDSTARLQRLVDDVTSKADRQAAETASALERLRTSVEHDQKQFAANVQQHRAESQAHKDETTAALQKMKNEIDNRFHTVSDSATKMQQTAAVEAARLTALRSAVEEGGVKHDALAAKVQEALAIGPAVDERMSSLSSKIGGVEGDIEAMRKRMESLSQTCDQLKLDAIQRQAQIESRLDQSDSKFEETLEQEHRVHVPREDFAKLSARMDEEYQEVGDALATLKKEMQASSTALRTELLQKIHEILGELQETAGQRGQDTGALKGLVGSRFAEAEARLAALEQSLVDVDRKASERHIELESRLGEVENVAMESEQKHSRKWREVEGRMGELEEAAVDQLKSSKEAESRISELEQMAVEADASQALHRQEVETALEAIEQTAVDQERRMSTRWAEIEVSIGELEQAALSLSGGAKEADDRLGEAEQLLIQQERQLQKMRNESDLAIQSVQEKTGLKLKELSDRVDELEELAVAKERQATTQKIAGEGPAVQGSVALENLMKMRLEQVEQSVEQALAHVERKVQQTAQEVENCEREIQSTQQGVLDTSKMCGELNTRVLQLEKGATDMQVLMAQQAMMDEGMQRKFEGLQRQQHETMAAEQLRQMGLERELAALTQQLLESKGRTSPSGEQEQLAKDVKRLQAELEAARGRSPEPRPSLQAQLAAVQDEARRSRSPVGRSSTPGSPRKTLAERMKEVDHVPTLVQPDTASIRSGARGESPVAGSSSPARKTLKERLEEQAVESPGKKSLKERLEEQAVPSSPSSPGRRSLRERMAEQRVEPRSPLTPSTPGSRSFRERVAERMSPQQTGVDPRVQRLAQQIEELRAAQGAPTTTDTELQRQISGLKKQIEEAREGKGRGSPVQTLQQKLDEARRSPSPVGDTQIKAQLRRLEQQLDGARSSADTVALQQQIDALRRQLAQTGQSAEVEVLQQQIERLKQQTADDREKLHEQLNREGEADRRSISLLQQQLAALLQKPQDSAMQLQVDLLQQHVLSSGTQAELQRLQQRMVELEQKQQLSPAEVQRMQEDIVRVAHQTSHERIGELEQQVRAMRSSPPSARHGQLDRIQAMVQDLKSHPAPHPDLAAQIKSLERQVEALGEAPTSPLHLARLQQSVEALKAKADRVPPPSFPSARPPSPQPPRAAAEKAYPAHSREVELLRAQLDDLRKEQGESELYHQLRRELTALQESLSRPQAAATPPSPSVKTYSPKAYSMSQASPARSLVDRLSRLEMPARAPTPSPQPRSYSMSPATPLPPSDLQGLQRVVATLQEDVAHLRAMEEVHLRTDEEVQLSLTKVEEVVRLVGEEVGKTEVALKEVMDRMKDLEQRLSLGGAGGEMAEVLHMRDALQRIEDAQSELRDEIGRVQADVDTNRLLTHKREEDMRAEVASAVEDVASTAAQLRHRISAAETTFKELEGWVETSQRQRDAALKDVERRMAAVEGGRTVSTARWQGSIPAEAPPPPPSPRMAPSTSTRAGTDSPRISPRRIRDPSPQPRSPLRQPRHYGAGVDVPCVSARTSHPGFWSAQARPTPPPAGVRPSVRTSVAPPRPLSLPVSPPPINNESARRALSPRVPHPTSDVDDVTQGLFD